MKWHRAVTGTIQLPSSIEVISDRRSPRKNGRSTTGQQMDYVVSPAGCDSAKAEDSATGDQLLVDEMLEQQMGSLWGLLADVYDSFAPLLVTPSQEACAKHRPTHC